MKQKAVKKVENKRMPFVSPAVQGIQRFKPGTFTKVMSIFLIVVSACLLAIWIVQKNGYHLINNAIFYSLLGLAVTGVLIWFVYGARKLVKRPALKRTITISSTVLAVILLLFTYVDISSRLEYLPKEFGRDSSPKGENELVVLQTKYIDYERMLAEMHEAFPDYSDEQVQEVFLKFLQLDYRGLLDEARTAYPNYTDAQIQEVVFTPLKIDYMGLFEEISANNPDYTDAQIQDAIFNRLQSSNIPIAYSNVYQAYPVRGRIFYYTNVEVGPELLVVAQDSEAELRVRWEDEDTAVLYPANPGPFDRGEFTVKCK